MKVAVLGLGYVGSVSASCLANHGHDVIGVDVNRAKVDMINRGLPPFLEPGLEELLGRAVADGRLRATTNTAQAVAASDVSLVSVGTPSRPNGSLDLQYVVKVAEEIAAALRRHSGYHVVALRSTMLPASLEETILPILREGSGRQPGVDFGLCSNPEFLREGSALKDFHRPPFTLIGAFEERSADLLQRLYAGLDAPTILTDPRTAEMVKYASNAFHGLKVAFANEIGLLCKAQGIDSHAVMDIFAKDTELNISARYMQPGFSFGGSCLPKDLRAVLHRAKSLDLELPVLRSILPSNEAHLERAVDLIERVGKRRVGLLGLSFKGGTDDLRESPMVRLAERLLGKGYDLRIADRNVSLSRLLGANKRYLEETIPHISRLLVPEIEQLLSHADTLVIGGADRDLRELLAASGKNLHVVDLVRASDASDGGADYEGICW